MFWTIVRLFLLFDLEPDGHWGTICVEEWLKLEDHEIPLGRGSEKREEDPRQNPLGEAL